MKKYLIVFGICIQVQNHFALDAPVAHIDAERNGDSVSVTLTWSEVPDAAAYNIYGLGNDPYGNSELLARVNTHQCTSSEHFGHSAMWDLAVFSVVNFPDCVQVYSLSFLQRLPLENSPFC